MPRGPAPARAAVGFSVKSGWACAVLMAGPVASPRVVDSCRIELSDPAIPESRQPYHAGFGTARGAGRELARLVAAVKQFGRKSVSTLIRRYRRDGHDVRAAGLVVGSLIEPDSIANAHIRIHALEGQLFRRLVRDAAARSGLRCAIWRERDLYASAAEVLKRPEPALRDTLTALGEGVAASWRAEQKMAALAAWLVLSARPPATRTVRGRGRAA